MRLWKMLHEQTMGRMAVVVDEDVKRDVFEHWLKVNGIKAAMYDVLDSDDPVVKSEKIQLLMTASGRVDWYIDVDPHTAYHTLRLGIPTLLFSMPYVVRPEWSGYKGARSWDSLVEEIDRQAEQRASKTWGDAPIREGDDL
jgi:hypothetical protein